MKNIFLLRLPVMLGASLLLTSALATAQDAPKSAQLAPVTDAIAPLGTTFERRAFQVRNVRVDFLAWWLDPSHQPMPIPIQSSINNGGKLRTLTPYLSAPAIERADAEQSLIEQRNRSGNALGPENLKLPPDITIIGVINPRKILLARGPQTSLDQLGELISEIDAPLTQVEVEMPIVEMARDDLRTLGLQFPENNTEKTDRYTRAAVTLAPDSASTSALNRLIAKGSARVINAPRLTAFSGLTAQLKSTESRSNTLDYDYKGDPKDLTPGVVFVASSTGLTCGVEVAGKTIALNATIEMDNIIATVKGTIRDGQTLAVRLPSFDPNSPTVRVAFLKPRILESTVD